MIRNRLSWLRNWRKDLFVQTQHRLTLQYCVLLMIFLALFIFIVYFLVDFAISFEQERQLRSITDQEAILMRDSLDDGFLSPEEFDNLNTIRQSGNQFFYYVVSPSGKLLFGDEFIHPVRPKVLKLVRGWVPDKSEIRYGTITPPLPPTRPGKPAPQVARDIQLMMAGRAIYVDNQLVGIFYTGKEISFTTQLIQRLLIILGSLGVLFLGIALLLGFWMSKRAMIPIRQSFQRQREFVADASHELRTPLSILHSSLDVIEMEEGDLSDFSRNVLLTMKDEVRRMTKLVSDLLTLARSDSGLPDLQYETFDFIPPLEQLLRSTQTLAHSKTIGLYLNAPVTLPVYGDYERLTQLVYILLDNAIKYTPTGGDVNLSMSIESPDKHPHLFITVQDTGVGIPIEDQERIFDRFYRVDKNRSKQMGGTGLGLAIAKWIVEAHHGTIKVTSTSGKGSTFTVKIPMTPQKG
ncbi:sensor histidine kinase [Brevibacillus dissolubilis]|uniref:sensor histidine kinase n=1 Tax=Brevibacillus dissolubilis TaxID=1844116 RepID=UPI00210004CB|nr:ATP-binding protein [Brevibacillus dissolubilis]